MKQPSEKLKAKWEKKLRDSGFADIENKDGSLKEEVNTRTLAYALKDGREEYYKEAREILNGEKTKFTTLLDYTVWKLHSEGVSFRKIGQELKLTFYKVRTIVKKIQKIAGLMRE